VTQSVTDALDQTLLTVTTVSITRLKTNSEDVTVIGSGRELDAMCSYTRENVTQSALDVLAQLPETVMHVTNMHSSITSVYVSV